MRNNLNISASVDQLLSSLKFCVQVPSTSIEDMMNYFREQKMGKLGTLKGVMLSRSIPDEIIPDKKALLQKILYPAPDEKVVHIEGNRLRPLRR